METNDVDIELQQAMFTLEKAKQRKADAESAARLAAATALARNLAAEEERLARLRQEAEAANRRAEEHRAQKEAAARAEQSARDYETRRLSQELESREEAARQEAARAERVRKVQEQAHQAELDAQNIEASLLQAQTPREEAKQVTLCDAAHPLSMIFAPSATPTAPIREISSEEHYRLQREAETKTVSVSVHKVKVTRDDATSGELAQCLHSILGQVNAQRCDYLASRYEPAALLNAAKVVVEQYKIKAVSHDGTFASIEAVLEAADESQT